MANVEEWMFAHVIVMKLSFIFRYIPYVIISDLVKLRSLFFVEASGNSYLLLWSLTVTYTDTKG